MSFFIASCSYSIDDLESSESSNNYFTTQSIDDDTFAIGEPDYYQKNYNYLIIGKEKSILFDSGPGIKDIKVVIESLTALPVIAAASHLHFDHIGNHHKFSEIALSDLSYLRERVDSNGGFLPTEEEHLGFLDNITPKILVITQWWADNSIIDIGSRQLEVLHVPGHTADSMVIFDRENNQLFAGDFIYPSNLIVSDVNAYITSATKLLQLINTETSIFTAHGNPSSPKQIPMLDYTDLSDLKESLIKLKNGSLSSIGMGDCGATYPVNEKISLEVC